jgi:pimeloyl-ACP methyl ester carboxylesterase
MPSPFGHDWGAEAAYGAAAFAPDCWRRVVTLAIPPVALNDRIFGDYEQLRRFFYLYFLKDARANAVVAADQMAFLDRLWADWSPGYDARDALKDVKACLSKPENLAAAIGYYRADEYRREQAALVRVGPQPTLYLHGEEDGCIASHLVADSERHLAPGSSMRLIADAGHFLHVEKPSLVNEAIVAWITR